MSGITEVAQPGGGLTNRFGYLPQPDGSYFSENYQIKEGYEKWPNYTSTALAGTAGWSHTKALIKEQGNDYIGGATTTFRTGSSNSTWFVPAAGQLAYIYLNVTNINTLLQKVSGATQIDTSGSGRYWSSSENDVICAWIVHFESGYVDTFSKNFYSVVRFCREL